MATSTQLRREILAGQWDEALCTLYGTEPAVLARQRQRYAAALEQFELYYGPGRQVHVYSAPGRAELGRQPHRSSARVWSCGSGDAGSGRSGIPPVTTVLSRVKSRGFNKLDVIDLSEAEPPAGREHPFGQLDPGHCGRFPGTGKDGGWLRCLYRQRRAPGQRAFQLGGL